MFGPLLTPRYYDNIHAHDALLNLISGETIVRKRQDVKGELGNSHVLAHRPRPSRSK